MDHKHKLKLERAGRMGYAFFCTHCLKQRTISKSAFWRPMVYFKWEPNLKGTSLA